jgi:hypothetical protein
VILLFQGENKMYLHIKFPKNLFTESIIQQKNIPCLCRIAANFEVVFQNPLQEAIGQVENWDRKEVASASTARVGGKYIHYDFGMITLKKFEDDIFEIIDLSFFNESEGWCQIYEGGVYAPRIREEVSEESFFGRKI